MGRLIPGSLTFGILAGILFSLAGYGQTPNRPATLVKLDATNVKVHPPVDLPMGGLSPDGHRISVNSQYLLLDGKPWLPVMGEFHYSRFPSQLWEEELLKMKAGGVQIVATYLFWIHHEEIKGEFDWSGDRNLRHFIELCKKHGLYVFIRIGPYAHGEVRNGGLPDWVLKQGPTRKNDPLYLASVGQYFQQIGRQIAGLRWKDGGPIVGVQLENEYYAHGPDSGSAHISELKKIANACGIEAPLYTVTGWGNPEFPEKEFIPVFGGYPDNFWESSITQEKPSGFYLFDVHRDNGEMGGNNGATANEDELARYPFLMAEAGGGMQVAYHRRPMIAAHDVSAITLTRLGSGANLYGYYMFHGGSNPAGKLTTLNESEASDHVYDLPVVSYDFQAPIGEYGQVRQSFRETRKLHIFLGQFGSELARMAPVAPEITPKHASDLSTVRAAARLSGDRGFLFVNNYVRGYPTKDHKNIQFELKLPTGTIRLPSDLITIHSGEYFVWPINFEMDGAVLQYATAQPLTKVQDGGTSYYFFFAQRDIPVEFAFRVDSVLSVEAPNAAVSHSDRGILIKNVIPGTGIAASLKSVNGRSVSIVVLSSEQASSFWSVSTPNGEVVFLATGDLFVDGSRLHLRVTDPGDLKLAAFPESRFQLHEGKRIKKTTGSGIFDSYQFAVLRATVPVRWMRARKAEEVGPGRKGKYNALAPLEATFERAGVWSIEIPSLKGASLSDVYLRIRYKGDIGRLYEGSTLVADDFYKGTEWELGLKRFGELNSGYKFQLKVIPLRRDAHIYMTQEAWPTLPPDGQIADVMEISAVPEYEVLLPLETTTR